MTRLALRSRRRWRILAGPVVALTVVALLTGPVAPASATASPATASAATAATASPASPAPAARPTPDGTHTVTLVTGDLVRVFDVGGGRQAAEVTRPHGARGGVRTETVGNDLYVLPDEALPYLAAGEVDRRLFNVSSLIRQGYDDEHSDGIPMILGYTASAATTKAAPAGTTAVRPLPSIRGTAVKAAKKHARDAWNSIAPSAAPVLGGGLAKVWLDAREHVDLAQSTAQIGAPTAWTAGYDGTGVNVAVLDTGYDTQHPDLAGRVSQAVSFVPGEQANDGNGHGTHTLSTVGGSGAASGGLEKGVAPGADLLVGKVLSDEGYGDDSWIISGMEWAAGQGARVISMSLGGSEPSDGGDPLSQAVNQLTAQTGALFVIAAGNTGAEASISSPGAADAALTVAAVDPDDQLAYFSSMGPRYGDYAMKPDIAAPGVEILAAKAGGTADTGWYQTMSGTSMATPHVAGAAAILAQEHPDWKAGQLKDALMSTSHQLSATAYQVGAGPVDIGAFLHAAVTGTGSIYFGFDAWPYLDTTPVDRTVSYTNTGATTVTLNLTESVAVAGGPYDVDPGADAGTPAPAGMFGLSAGSVTVPAHGTATVTATARPSLGAAGRRYLGQIVARDAATGAAVRTQVGLYREDERHLLHVSVTDRAGNPAAGYLELQQFGVPDPSYVYVDGRADLRLRAGTYSVRTYVEVPGAHGPDSLGLALLGNPEVILDRDRTVVLDARQAREVSAQVPRTTEDRVMYLDWYRSDGGDSVLADQYLLPPQYDTMYALPTAKVTKGSFEFEARWRKAYPLLTMADHGRSVAFLGQAGSPLYDGHGNLDAVYAGTGTPAEYAGLRARGRAVLVTRSDALTGTQRAQAAAAARAALLIEVNDGPGKLLDYVGNDDGSDAGVTVVSVTARTGAQLIAEARRGQLRLTVDGVPDSPYVYDLTDPHAGQIPTDLTYRPRPDQLATVDMRFHGISGDTRYASGDFRWDYRPYRQFASGFWLRVDAPGTRTDYVSTQPGDEWADSAVTGPGMSLVSSADLYALKAGTRTVSDWFGPVTRPRDGGGFWSSTRYDGFIAINVQPWADGGAGHAGYIVDGAGDTRQMKVYQDGVLVSTSGWASANLYPVPTVPSIYTLDLTASRDPSVYRLSPRTHTVWTVRSAPVAHPDDIDLMPVLQLDYRVDTDLAGDADGGRQSLGLTASHLPGAVGTGRIVGATLAVSYDDGATWQPVALTRSGTGDWTASFTAPRHGFVSMKAAAWDSVGNRISQEVIRAYGLNSTGKGGDRLN